MKTILVPCFPRPSEGKQTPKVLQGPLLVTFQLLNAFQKSQAQLNYRGLCLACSLVSAWLAPLLTVGFCSNTTFAEAPLTLLI